MSVLLLIDNVPLSVILSTMLTSMGIDTFNIEIRELIANGGKVDMAGMIDDPDYGIQAIVSSGQYSWVRGIKSAKDLIDMLRKECKGKLNILLICIDDDEEANGAGWNLLIEGEHYTTGKELAEGIAMLIDLKSRWEDPSHPDYGLTKKEYKKYMRFCAFGKEGQDE